MPKISGQLPSLADMQHGARESQLLLSNANVQQIKVRASGNG